MPPWVSVSTSSTLSPNTFSVLGERARVRGSRRADTPNSRFVPTRAESATKPEIGNRSTDAPSPHLSPESPQKAGDSGERSETGRIVYPGRRPRLLPRACPGLPSDALSGRTRGSSGLLPLHD